jgi:ATP adenylyltransferase
MCAAARDACVAPAAAWQQSAMPTPHDNPVDPTLSAHEALQAPWRMQYLESIAEGDAHAGGGPGGSGGAKASGGASGGAGGGSTGCFIRDYWLSPQQDAANHVVARTAHGMIFLNAFPYSNGHLLVALGESRPRLLDYDAAQRARLWALVDAAADLAEVALQPQGLNIGVNQGRAAGAGVPQHLHVHVIPRWGGDTNFITTVGRVRVIPASLDVMYARFAAAWRRVGPEWMERLKGE